MVGKLIVSAAAGAAAPAEGAASPATAAEQEAAATPAAEATPAAAAPEEAAQAAEPVKIVSKDIFFEPKAVTIPANTDVTITLPNEGVTAHNFSIDTLDISVDIAPGETKEVVINAPAGTYEFYCNVPGHKEAGMVGKLTVVARRSGRGGAGGLTRLAASSDAGGSGSSPSGHRSRRPRRQQRPRSGGRVGRDRLPGHHVRAEQSHHPGGHRRHLHPAERGRDGPQLQHRRTGHQRRPSARGDEEIVINAPAGTYEFYCNVPGHKEAGMVGTLTFE